MMTPVHISALWDFSCQDWLLGVGHRPVLNVLLHIKQFTGATC